MKRIVTCIVVAIWLIVGAYAQEVNNTFLHGNPQLSISAGFDLAQLDHYGFETRLNYYPYANSWFRVGPSAQLSYLFSPERKWFQSDDKLRGLLSAVHGNVLVNMEFTPFRSNSFYIGISPYVGFQSFVNTGWLTNENTPLHTEYDYRWTGYDFGLRAELGGFFGRKQQHGLEAHVQFTLRSLTGENPRVHVFTVGALDYLAYVGVSYIYSIMQKDN